MILSAITEYLKGIKEYHYLLEQVRKEDNTLLYGLTGSQKGFIATLIKNDINKPLLYIVENSQRGKEVLNDLSTLLSDKQVLYFPSLELLPFEVIAQSHETQRKRLEVLYNLSFHKDNVVVTTIEAISKTLIDPGLFAGAVIEIKVGEQISIEKLLSHLISVGYQRVDMVEDKGQVSLRGAILDIFPSTTNEPYRIELFDNEIESIRMFSIENQRSIEKIEGISIAPAAEFFFLGQDGDDALKEMNKDAEQIMNSLIRRGNREGSQILRTRMSEIKENIEGGTYFPGYQQYLPYFSSRVYCLLDYFKESPLVIIDEPNRQKESSALYEKEMQETYVALLEKGKILPGQLKNYMSWEEINRVFNTTKRVYFSLLPKKPIGVEEVNLVGVAAKTPSLFMGKTKILIDELKEWKNKKFTVLIFTNTHERAERLAKNLWDLGLETAAYTKGQKLQAETIYIATGYLTNGFELTTWKIAVLTEHEIFYQPKKRIPKKMFGNGKKTTILDDLKQGDYVVHINHGIGRYLGINKLSVGDSERDYLVIKYQGEDRLYVPTEQVSLLHKYHSQEGQMPKLSKLGGNEWSKIKNKVKGSVKDLAEELLSLYAARQAVRGMAFSADSPWQNEFEEAFPFEETPDQIKTIREVKEDMEKPRPMDRLLCGDVGYGKTEVAMRAIFKAITDGKQAAVLVPTTVLAQQHYNTFRERFEGFAVNVGVLSRFKSAKEQKEIVQQLKEGKIDIIIGTHRLLSSDVSFRELGLLVVDEEQRFGVIHKEKLKKLRKSVDVLTLSATPIPRTLYMSLIGVRDMSVIETPPENRYPVQTFVVENSPQLIRDAVRRELGRGGQVYYVHNRIEDIDKTANWLKELVPEARIGIGYGKMTEEQLEKIMLEFMEGELDVLVCTTIIETGLDITNVNTLIIDDADKMGLSQLYQLRGRVGRSNRVAYAYLTYNKDKILSEVAEKRLTAICEFTELGSGYRIAMRDLEIRGAGNILGAEQHGHVAAVGFELYCRMLEEAVREAKGEELPKKQGISIDIQVKAYIPQEYIQDVSVKIDFYQRINEITSLEDINKLKDELEDRFGEIPEPLKNLLKITSIKVAALETKVAFINQEKDLVIIKMEDNHQLSGKQLFDLARKFRRQISFNTSMGLEIIISIKSIDKERLLPLLEEVVMEISSLAQAEVTLI